MKTFVLLAMGITVLVLSGCANDLTPETTDRGPAPWSPDPMSHVPDPNQQNNPANLGGGGRY